MNFFRTTHSLGATLVALATLAACGDDTNPTGGAAPGGGGSGAGTNTGGSGDGGAPQGGAGGSGGSAPLELSFDWYACPYIEGVQNGECAAAEVPLDWSQPDGKKIPFFVKRVKAAVQPARGQLWILQGGPGYSGASIEFTGPRFAGVAPDLDLYFPDHRGTGNSAVLTCPSVDALSNTSRPLDPQSVATKVNQCLPDLTAEWGDGLQQFSATGAGRDLGEAIAALRAPEEEVFVYGVSYGTRWTHRYLQQFPTQATGVIFDSIVGEPSTWLDFDVGIDGVGRQLLELCGADSYCQSRLGPDPVAFLETLLDKVDTGHCPTSKNLGRDDYKAFFTTLVVSGNFDRGALPALIYRVDRCDAKDQQVIAMFYDSFESPPSPFHSGALHFNVVSGELIEADPPTMDELSATDAGLIISSSQMRGYRAAYDLWPRYQPGPLNGTFADTEIPILMMQSPLDAQTTVGPAAAFASHYTKAHQTYVEVQGAAHAIINESSAPLADGTACGMVLAGQFLNDPTAAIDTSCKDQVLPLDFEKVGFNFGAGTINMWDNAAGIAAPAPGAQELVNALDVIKAERQLRGAK